MKVGFTCGAFDLMHFGHIRMLRQFRLRCDKLVVGLQTDPSIDRPDTKVRPIQTVMQRIEMLEGIKYIDDILLYTTEDDLVMLLSEVRPNVRFLGEDWIDKEYTGRQLNIETVFLERDHDFSSTEFRKKLIQLEVERSKILSKL